MGGGGFHPFLGAFGAEAVAELGFGMNPEDRKSTRLNSRHSQISYAVFCMNKIRLARKPRHRITLSKTKIFYGCILIPEGDFQHQQPCCPALLRRVHAQHREPPCSLSPRID